MSYKIVLFLLFFCAATFLQAANFNPLPSTSDGAPGSLRDAIHIANTNGQDDVITLSAGTYTLTIPGINEDNNATGDLDIRPDGGNTLTIRGAGIDVTFIDGSNLDMIMHVQNAETVIEDISFINAEVTPNTRGFAYGIISKFGGRALSMNRCKLADSKVRGLFAFGPIALNRCVIENNINPRGPGAAINNLFTPNSTFENCIFRNNRNLPQGPGGVYVQNATTQFINCLFDSNISAGSNGALRNEFSASNCKLLNCTFANNQGSDVGRAEVRNVGTMDIQNCIFYHPASINFENLGAAAVTTSSGGNISSDNSMAGFLTNTKDLNDTDPFFINPASGDYRPKKFSPAVENGVFSAELPESDLLGSPRIQDGNGNGASIVDAGAFELLRTIPTMSQWALLLFGLILLNLGAVTLYNFRTAKVLK